MSEQEKTKFSELTHRKYIDQAKWYLNGFWLDGAQKEAEQIWSYTQKFIELDTKKKEGTELDEFWSHKFLEHFGEPMTVITLREKLRKIDMDMNGKMALLEFLAFRYGKTPKQVIDAPQGGNEKEIIKATQLLEAVQTSLEQQKKAEEQVKQAEAENKAALEELNSQESAYQNQIKTLEEKSSSKDASTVQRSKASNELAQLKGQDPLPLKKAKITQEATVRKVEKERKKAEEATAACEAKVKEAEDYLHKVMAEEGGDVARGALWWLDRELKEAQKYMPQKKQQK